MTVAQELSRSPNAARGIRRDNGEFLKGALVGYVRSRQSSFGGLNWENATRFFDFLHNLETVAL